MAKSYFYPNLGFRTYRKHSALIPSVVYLHLKYGRYLCIVQIPGSIRLHTQLRCNITTKYQFITTLIQIWKIFITNLHSIQLAVHRVNSGKFILHGVPNHHHVPQANMLVEDSKPLVKFSLIIRTVCNKIYIATTWVRTIKMELASDTMVDT